MKSIIQINNIPVEVEAVAAEEIIKLRKIIEQQESEIELLEIDIDELYKSI